MSRKTKLPVVQRIDGNPVESEKTWIRGPYRVRPLRERFRMCRTCIRERGRNIRDRRRAGLPSPPRSTGPRKLTDEQVAQIRKMRAEGATYRRVASTFRISLHTVWQICKNKTWRPKNSD
jgi:DNA invertase Pin-like site-specific DNA recombinase